MKHRPITYLLIGVAIAIGASLSLPKQEETSHKRDFAEIMKEGELRVTTEYGKHAYYVDENDSLRGKHYELVSAFARHHGLRLTVIPEMSISRQNEMLQNGECDIIATARPITVEKEDGIRQTKPIGVDKQIVVQRKKQEVADTLQTDTCIYLNSLIDLAGKSVCLPKDSPFKHRLAHLIEEIGDTIRAYEIPRYSTEQLMAMVAHGDICYAICEKEIVNEYIEKYPNLDVDLEFSFNQFHAWTIRELSTELADSLNAWIEQQGFIRKQNKR